VSATPDLRPMLFGGAEWYERLQPPAGDELSVWWVAKSPSPERWTPQVLTAAAQFAQEHGLLELYRAKFRGIAAAEFLPARAQADRRSVSFPIWEIAHELLVARYLERVLGGV
jgi:hypothetical protein